MAIMVLEPRVICNETDLSKFLKANPAVTVEEMAQAFLGRDDWQKIINDPAQQERLLGPVNEIVGSALDDDTRLQLLRYYLRRLHRWEYATIVQAVFHSQIKTIPLILLDALGVR